MAAVGEDKEGPKDESEGRRGLPWREYIWLGDAVAGEETGGGRWEV